MPQCTYIIYFYQELINLPVICRTRYSQIILKTYFCSISCIFLLNMTMDAFTKLQLPKDQIYMSKTDISKNIFDTFRYYKICKLVSQFGRDFIIINILIPRCKFRNCTKENKYFSRVGRYQRGNQNP